jgi:AcrR family transcriptional regulator
MVAKDTTDSRSRLLDAAMSEFASCGVAGARIDRIAAQAGCSKGLIYTYWGSKEALFDAVLDQFVDATFTDITLDPIDLGEYAGRLYDSGAANPDIVRLVTWYRLERTNSDVAPPEAVAALESHIATVRDAQLAGHVTDRLDPLQLVLLARHIAAVWSVQGPEVLNFTESVFRRRTVVDAVRRLAAP